MSTHIEALKEDIANRVILSGDPLRIKYIAEKYLENAKIINNVRGMLGYTGYYNNVRITLLSIGMGIPSAGIYTYELFNNYDVDYVIKLGTAGSYDKDFKVNDVAIAKDVYSTSIYENDYDGSSFELIEANKELNEIIKETAKEDNIVLKEARVYTTDNFYTKNDITDKMREEKKCNLVEMEMFAVLTNAKIFNKKATCILTVSDSFITKEEISNEEKEKRLDTMIKLGLDSIIKI